MIRPFTKNVALWFVAVLALGGVMTLNVNGFCYSKRRFLSDEEIIRQTLSIDWQANMRRIANRDPKQNAESLSEFLEKVPTWGKVVGRQISRGWLFSSPQDTQDAYVPPQILRFFGIYRVYSGMAFMPGAGEDRYLTWFRVFDQCGSTPDRFRSYEDKLDESWRPIADWTALAIKADNSRSLRENR